MSLSGIWTCDWTQWLSPYLPFSPCSGLWDVPLSVRPLWLHFVLVCARGYLCLAEQPSPAAPCPLCWAQSAGLVQQELSGALSRRSWWTSLCQSASSHWLGKSQHHSSACRTSAKGEHSALAQIYFQGIEVEKIEWVPVGVRRHRRCEATHRKGHKGRYRRRDVKNDKLKGQNCRPCLKMRHSLLEQVQPEGTRARGITKVDYREWVRRKEQQKTGVGMSKVW